MKKSLVTWLLILEMLLMTACSSDLGQAAAEDHTCQNVCLVCSLCTDEACTERACREKCFGHQEKPYPFYQGNYITTEAVSVDTGKLVFDIQENVFVPGNLELMGQALAEAMEQVSGLSFDGAGFANGYPDGKVHANVTRAGLYDGQTNYGGLTTSELGDAYADPREHALISAGDLFLGHSKALPHELAHVLMYRQSEWNHSQLLNEGFAEYTAFLTMQQMDQNGTGFYMDRPTQCLADMLIFDYEQLYEQPLEYWFENTFAYGSNDNYCIGFHFMVYLHQVYGDYSGWVTAFEQTFPCGGEHKNSDSSQQIQVLQAVYGDDVLDGFYPWLQQNEAWFSDQKDFTQMRPIMAEGVSMYPEYNAWETFARITSFAYNDLYISIDSLRQYIEEYKGGDASNLVLYTSQPVQVNLYKADGSYISVMTNSQTVDPPIGTYLYVPEQWSNVFSEVDTVLSLEDVSYIKLVGAGKLELLEVYGSFTQYNH